MGPIEALAHELMLREMDKPKQEWRAPQSEAKPTMEPLNPEVAALIGTALDGVGTYMMLDQGVGTEGNPLHKKLWNQNPKKTGLGVAAAGVGMSAIRNLLRQKGGKRGGWLADLLAGQSGADQMLAGLQHFQSLDVPYPGAVQRRIDPRGGETRRMERVREGVAGVRKD